MDAPLPDSESTTKAGPACAGGHAEDFRLRGPVGPLESCLTLPEGSESPRAAAVVCHPHPRFGGTMSNKVVVYLARALRRQGAATLRFNFRGVGTSRGQFAGGKGEADDAGAALAALAGRFPETPLWAVGFSFGAFAGLRAAALDPRVCRLAAVAPPVDWYDFGFLEAERRSVLIAQGGCDEVVDPQSVRRFRARLERAPEWLWFPEADHFFSECLGEMSARVAERLAAPGPLEAGPASCNVTRNL